MGCIKILDCTLRDGGYINDWKFGKEAIDGIISGLVDAKIDIIECGFIRYTDQNEDSSVFSSMDCLSKRLFPKKDGISFAVMIEQHNHVDSCIPPFDGKGADIIRVSFRKTEWGEAKETIQQLKNKGYKVCVQPVGTATYDDESLIKLIKDVNSISPYAFYLVDTLGMMYTHEMRRFFYLIDNCLSNSIALGFHSHNNLQLSFSNAQEMLRLNRKREIIIDSSCFGMGRGVGNLATELLADYVNNNIEQKYSLIPIMSVIDKYLMPIYAKTRWGYDLPYFLSAVFKCHPNYASYLMKKDTLDIENIEKILSLLPKQSRSEFDAELIEKIYFDYMNCFYDDSISIEDLKQRIYGKIVVLLGPGSSLIHSNHQLEQIANKNSFIISVNFYTSLFKIDAVFISNEKRMVQMEKSALNNVNVLLLTSNLKHSFGNAPLVFNYASYLGEGDGSDNAGAMIIRILKKAGVSKICLAGFDGFDVDSSKNYFLDKYKKDIDYETAMTKNSVISKQLKLALDGVNYAFITETKYKI